MDEIWTLFVSDIGEHSGHLRNTIGVIDLFLDDPAWKKPNTDENSENFPPEITVLKGEVTFGHPKSQHFEILIW